MCAKSKIKCSGGIPCGHCAARSLECSYQHRKRRSTAYRTEDEAWTDPDDQLPTTTTTTRDSNSEGYDTEDDAVIGEQNSDATARDHGFTHVDQNEVPEQQEHRQWQTPFTSVAISSTPDDTSPPGATFTVSPVPDASSGPLTQAALGSQLDDSPMATNWLPFDYALASGTDPSYLDFESSQAPYEGDDSEAICSQSLDSTARQNDQVSALITYMRDRPPAAAVSGLNTPASLPQPGLYAAGAGFRESQADRHYLQRHIARSRLCHSGESRWQSRLPWEELLIKEVRHGKKKHKQSLLQIPEAIFWEVKQKLLPRDGRPILSAAFLIRSDVLLDRDTFTHLIQLYFDNFHALYPFLDRSLLCIPVWGWSLCIATAAIGARYFGVSELTMYGEELCSVLHELLLIELNFGRVQDSLPYIQARMLAAVGMCQSQLPSHIKCGHVALSLACNSCLQLQVLDEDDEIGSYQQGQTVEQVWLAWRFRETRRRTGLFIWIMDSCLAFATEHPPNMPLKNLQLRAPSKDDLWEADSYQAWLKIARGRLEDDATVHADRFLAEEAKRQSIREATESLWRNLCAPECATEFGTTIIIHFLLCRRWAADQFLGDRLALDYQSPHHTQLPPRDRYLGSVPEYAKWRNYTCDCLDVLHFESAGLSVRRGGFEDSVFLHLHMSRLVILVPVAELLEYAHENINMSSSQFLPHHLYRLNRPDTKWRQAILTWVNQDRYKARLAVIHAGALFWHVRRYSSHALVEPFAVFLAALVLWAFVSARGSEPAKNSSSGNDENISQSLEATGLPATHDTPKQTRRMPSTIQIDRPVDDELVQHFIRSGDHMRISMEGVDDLYSKQGPLQILREAVGVLLEHSSVWTISESYATYLDAIACELEKTREERIV
ncbi:unnamed protein product [Clonostachys solani]|uniref:Zn(2)-C6 fungal-type domain-containing protein n=1 Tax=Clonostachys solani TaxID=160281 RepID=A0A9P0ENM2_9HYPO|nr:unnamed protein product [Clonostachys solani]